MSANRIQIRASLTDKKITLPVGQIFDEVGREQLIKTYEEVELQDAINIIQDYETTRYNYGNPGADDNYNIFYEFKFFDPVNNDYGINSVNFNHAGFLDKDLARQYKSFTKSFFKFDYYDSPIREEQKLMFTMVMPTTNCKKDEVMIDPVEDPVAYYAQLAQGVDPNNIVYDIYIPEVQLGPAKGKDENYYIHWLKKRDLFDIETFYMSCKFFNAKTGKATKFLNADPQGHNGVYEPTDWFYYQVDIEINELQYPKYNYRVRAFNNSVLITGTLMGEKGMSSAPNVSTTPIMFYEHI